MVLFDGVSISCDGIQKDIIDNTIKYVNKSFGYKRELLLEPFCHVDVNMYKLFTAVMVYAMTKTDNDYLIDSTTCSSLKIALDNRYSKCNLNTVLTTVDIDYLTYESILDYLAITKYNPDFVYKYMLSLLLCIPLTSVDNNSIKKLQSIIKDALIPKVDSIDWAKGYIDACSDYIIHKYFPVLKNISERGVKYPYGLSMLLLTRMYAVCYDYIGSYWHKNCIFANVYSKDYRYSMRLVDLLCAFGNNNIDYKEVITSIDSFIYRNAVYIRKNR